MENNETPLSSVRQLPVFVQLLIGIAGGACISGLLLFIGSIGIPLTMLMFQAIIIGGIVYGFGGIPGAAAMAATAEIGIYITSGSIGSMLMLTAFVFPYAVMVWSSEKCIGFFRTIEYSMLAGGLGIVISLLTIVKMSGSDIGKLLSDLMSASIDTLSDSGKKALADIYASIYAYSGYTLDVSDPAALLKSIAASMEDAVKISMPFMLICLVTENVLLGSLISSFIRVKRKVPGASYAPVSKWRLPAKVTIGVILFIIVGFILSKTNGSSGEVVFVTALGTGFIACEVQMIASMYDKLTAIGFRFIFRILWILFLVIGFGFFPILYGGLSMLIGRYGLVKQMRAFFALGKGSDSSDKNGGI